MKFVIVFFVAILVGEAEAQARLPALTCVAREGYVVRHAIQRGEPWVEGSTIYRIDRKGSLFIKAKGQSEYHYGALKETDIDRYEAGHKVVFFEKGFGKAILVHTNDAYVDVTYADCVKND